MANDSLILRCNVCGNYTIIGKTLMGGYYTPLSYSNTKSFEDILNDFYKEHAFCAQHEHSSVRQSEPDVPDTGHEDGDFRLEYFMDDDIWAEDGENIICTNCDAVFREDNRFNFCPNCGRRMKRKKQTE